MGRRGATSLNAMDTDRYIEVIDHLVAAARTPVLTEMSAIAGT